VVNLDLASGEDRLQLIDTHCHLYSEPLSRDPAAAVARARDAGVRDIVVPAYDLASWRDVRDLAVAHDGVHPALGLHPWVAGEPLDGGSLHEALVQARAVAIGEIGLDYKIDGPDRARQREVFVLQVDLARELDLPVILHCRGAFEDMLAILEERAGGLRGVVHAFSRGPDLMRRFVALGLFIAFGGAVTRPRAQRAQKSAAKVPLDRLLLETDAPAIGLDGVDAEDAEPRHVREIAAAVAALRGLEPLAIAEITTFNARELFRI
jgi:TatD DNase family protein